MDDYIKCEDRPERMTQSLNSELRKDCTMRHENGNCMPAGGFCTANNDCICKALHNAYADGYAAGYAAGQHGRWISVDDALPEIDVRVIVYCDDPFDIPPHFPHRKLLLIGYLGKGNNWYDSDGPLENVTHWMPLPKPPVVEVDE